MPISKRCSRLPRLLAAVWLASAAAAPLAQGLAAEPPREARAVVRALDRAVLSSEIAARVTELPLRAGESFEAGDLLVAFDCALLEAQRSRATAELDGARKTLANARELETMGSVGALEVALSAAEVNQLRAAHRITELSVQRCRIHAPFAGRVVAVHARAHESLGVQAEVIEVASSDALELEIIAPATWLAWLQPGQALEVLVDETGARLGATVHVLGAAVDPVSQTVVVRARFDGKPALLPGMSGRARFESGAP